MLIKCGAIVTECSGSLGGHTLQHSKGGNQLRTKPIPRGNPSASQYAIRSINPVLQAGWRQLTDSQRNIWDSYAQDYGITNAHGDHRPLSGHSYWMQYNFFRLYNSFSIALTPPLRPFSNEINTSYLITAVPASNIYPVTFTTSNQKTLKLKFLYNIQYPGTTAGWNITVSGVPRSLTSDPTMSGSELTLILSSEILYSERLSVVVNYDCFAGSLKINNHNPTITAVTAVNNYLALYGDLSLNNVFTLLSAPGINPVQVQFDISIARQFRNSIHWDLNLFYLSWKYPDDNPKTQNYMLEVDPVGSANFTCTTQYTYTSGSWDARVFPYLFNCSTLQPNLFDTSDPKYIHSDIP